MVRRQIPVSVMLGEPRLLGGGGLGMGERCGVQALPFWDSRDLTPSDDSRGRGSKLKMNNRQ